MSGNSKSQPDNTFPFPLPIHSIRKTRFSQKDSHRQDEHPSLDWYCGWVHTFFPDRVTLGDATASFTAVDEKQYFKFSYFKNKNITN